jgi:hypothetical protein
MNKQPEALRLADALTTPYTEINREAATELRRLHEVNVELLESLQGLMHEWTTPTEYLDAAKAARAAIAKATGETE